MSTDRIYRPVRAHSLPTVYRPCHVLQQLKFTDRKCLKLFESCPEFERDLLPSLPESSHCYTHQANGHCQEGVEVVETLAAERREIVTCLHHTFNYAYIICPYLLPCLWFRDSCLHFKGLPHFCFKNPQKCKLFRNLEKCSGCRRCKAILPNSVLITTCQPCL